MRITPIFASAALAGLVTTGAMAGDMSKTGPGLQEPVVSTPAAPVAPARFNWTGGYAGAGLGYGNMKFGGDSASSATAALFAGYRQDMGYAVLGAEALLAPVAFGSPTLSSGDEIKGGGALLFTAGLPVSADARTLAYVGVGPSLLRTSGAAGSENSIGGMATIGVDHMLTDSIMLRGSVNYTGINNVGVDNTNTRTLGAGVGVGFKF